MMFAEMVSCNAVIFDAICVFYSWRSHGKDARTFKKPVN